MLKWIRSCFTQRGPFLARTPLILYIDSYGSHNKEEVSESLRYRSASELLVIPPKMTSVLHPLDVSLNSFFKAALRRGWLDWLINGFKRNGCKRISSATIIPSGGGHGIECAQSFAGEYQKELSSVWYCSRGRKSP